jgi:hypothetical protein
MNTQQLIEALLPKWKVGDIATYKRELVALDSHSMTPRRSSDHCWGEINASDALLVCLRQCECKPASSTKSNFENAIHGLNVE